MNMFADVKIWMDATHPQWLLLEPAYFLIAGILGFIAFKSKSEWTKASLASLAISIVAWRVLAVLPSWWLYYSDAKLHWGGNGCVNLDMQCLKQAAKDTVVVIENAVGLGAFGVAFWLYQKKYPRQLGPGESKLEATGGYK
ncbi:MAG: hypothetical protein ACYDCC_15540 [Actinomycetota bacterium]